MVDSEKKTVVVVDKTPSGGICFAFGVLFPFVYLIVTHRPMQKPFLRFHCFQCLILFALWIPLIISRPFGPARISSIGSLVFLVAWLVATIQAERRKRFHLPIIGAVAEWFTGK